MAQAPHGAAPLPGHTGRNGQITVLWAAIPGASETLGTPISPIHGSVPSEVGQGQRGDGSRRWGGLSAAAACSVPAAPLPWQGLALGAPALLPEDACLSFPTPPLLWPHSSCERGGSKEVSFLV